MSTPKTTTKTATKTATKAATKTASKKSPPRKAAKAPPPRMTLAEAMRALEKSGTAQARKIYTRHGATEPMFGVSFAALKEMTKRIDVDHELALALWDTGNFDAQNLAVKIVDPARMKPADLEHWARSMSASRMCGAYAAMLGAETPHGAAKATEWLASKNAKLRSSGWVLLGQLAQRDEATPDAYFEKRLAEIERTIHTSPNDEREAMNLAVITIGGRSPGLRQAALAAAKRIGKVEIDHGETGCKTHDATEYLKKYWAHATAKGFASPAAQERARDVPRRRC